MSQSNGARQWKARRAFQNNGPDYWIVTTGEWGIPEIARVATEDNAVKMAAAPDMLEAIEGLLKNAPKPKGIKKDFRYILYLEAARKAANKARGIE